DFQWCTRSCGRSIMSETAIMDDRTSVQDSASSAVLVQYRAKDSIVTPSNLISLMRAFMVLPAIFALIAHLYILVASIFVVAFLSDLLDGLVARRTNTVSELGKIIDPLADKIFVGLVVIAMAAYGLIPIWFLVAIIVRDLIILAGGIWAKRKLGVVLPSNYPGKAAVLIISLTLFLIMTGVPGNIITGMEWLAIALMVGSLFVYGRRLGGLLSVAK
ncbi:MAG TPA: CDP-alcohol phosphatidyltransferase family protein, partial [Candidatus Kapabacteria bacterium]|nr:CDP-alcohol phosphatidyltransferase family protein [Candidatus Kapabacteria bacterium]